MTRKFIPYCRGCGFLMYPKVNDYGFTGCICKRESYD